MIHRETLLNYKYQEARGFPRLVTAESVLEVAQGFAPKVVLARVQVVLSEFHLSDEVLELVLSQVAIPLVLALEPRLPRWVGQ